ncbi:MAG: DMT family transporter [Rhodospirillales bacterium]|nr:DMT family transporter [Rhodospirillales bacterium]
MTALRSLAATARARPALAALALMLAATLFLAAMHGAVRFVSAEMHAFEIAFFRNVFGFCVLVPRLMRIGLAAFATHRFPLHAARGLLNGGSMLMWFLGLSLIPLAEATALSLASPLIATAGAIVFLGERMRVHRWLGLALGVAGMLAILRPGFEEIGTGAMAVLLSAVLVTASKLIAKSLTRTETPTAIVAWLTALMIPVTAIPAALVWQTPTAAQLAMLAGIGALGSAGHLCLIHAYRLADVGLVEPLVFFRLVWAALLGFLVFAEIPDLWIWIGGLLIVAATTHLARREGGPSIRRPPGSYSG